MGNFDTVDKCEAAASAHGSLSSYSWGGEGNPEKGMCIGLRKNGPEVRAPYIHSGIPA